METGTLCVNVVGLISISFILYQSRYLNRQEKAFIWDYKTDKALFAWRRNNPDFYIGDCLHARKLVLERIEAVKHLHEVCAWLKRDEDYIKFLYSLLNEHGPEPPRKTKRTPKQHKKLCCFSFVFVCGASVSQRILRH